MHITFYMNRQWLLLLDLNYFVASQFCLFLLAKFNALIPHTHVSCSCIRIFCTIIDKRVLSEIQSHLLLEVAILASCIG